MCLNGSKPQCQLRTHLKFSPQKAACEGLQTQMSCGSVLKLDCFKAFRLFPQPDNELIQQVARVVPEGLFSTCTVVLQDLLLHLLHYLLSQGRNYSVQVKQSTSHVSQGSELGIIKIINSQVTQKDVFHHPVLQLTKNGSVKKKDGRGWQSAF